MLWCRGSSTEVLAPPPPTHLTHTNTTAGTIIDHEDPAWSFYAIFKLGSDEPHPDANGSTPSSQQARVFVGFVSVYRMFAYPDKLKQRVCQFLVLPPFQRQVRLNFYHDILLMTPIDSSANSFQR